LPALAERNRGRPPPWHVHCNGRPTKEGGFKMNTTIGKRGLLAATIAGFFSVGAHAQQASENEVQQLRTQLEQGSRDLQ